MIAIHVDARNLGKKGAGFSVQLRCGKFVWRRTMKLGKVTANYAELRAFEYALKSIKPEFLNQEISIESSGKYVPMMLERDDSGWKRNPKTYVDDVTQIRILFEKFSKASAKKGDSDILTDLRELNEKCLRGEPETFTKGENIVTEKTPEKATVPGVPAVVEKKAEPKQIEEPKLEEPESPKPEKNKPVVKTVVEKTPNSADPTLVNLLSSLGTKKDGI